jgi:hypothetical protein
MKNRNSLSKDVQTYIVRGLACYETPSEVARAVNKEFGIEVTRQTVETYDPTKVAGSRRAKKWRAMFDQAREAFLHDVANVPIAHKAFRLRALQRMLDKCEQAGNLKMAAELLEQAAKEIGGMFTNRLDLRSSDGSMSPRGRTLDEFYSDIREPTYRLVHIMPAPPMIDVTPIRTE